MLDMVPLVERAQYNFIVTETKNVLLRKWAFLNNKHLQADNLCIWRVVKFFDCNSDFKVPYELKEEFDNFQKSRKVEIRDPFDFWKLQSGQFPNLSKIAVMYLSIPKTSCDIERFFSKFHNFLGDNQFNMSEESIKKRTFIMFN